ncbi:hypothetical protein [Nocardioides sp.]|uniref:hypothetical protein n=1 Tax=Nocardioides sp. TaxID=35761 RepID=UPI001A18B2C8|nr:hypothetical protein [Nocardioides sp.]MBJ7358562.1 hypothetical protein [Nocardioides sp.]
MPSRSLSGRRRGLPAASTLLAMAVLTGCAGDEKGGNGVDAPVAAPGASSSTAPGETFSPSSSSTTGPSSGATSVPADTRGRKIPGERFAALLRGSLDKATTAHVTMTDGGGTPDVEGDVDYTTSPPSLAMTVTSPMLGTETEVRVVAGSTYVTNPGPGKKWFVLSPADLEGALGDQLDEQLDPAETFERFADAVLRATDHGPEDVDGRSLTHYTSVVSTKGYLGSSDPGGAAASQLPDSMTQEWWFDTEGRIGRFSSEDALGDELVIVFTDWGGDVRIAAPPPGQVASLPASPPA